MTSDFFLTALREEPMCHAVVWDDQPSVCLCCEGHQHHGAVTAGKLADLVEAGDERAAKVAWGIICVGVVMATVRGRSGGPVESQ